MNLVEIKKYGPVISSDIVAMDIYREISSLIKNGDDKITIDFDGVTAFSTYCARQIFGEIFAEIGKDSFINKLSLINANGSVKSVITEAVSKMRSN